MSTKLGNERLALESVGNRQCWKGWDAEHADWFLSVCIFCVYKSCLRVSEKQSSERTRLVILKIPGSSSKEKILYEEDRLKTTDMEEENKDSSSSSSEEEEEAEEDEVSESDAEKESGKMQSSLRFHS